MSSTSDGPALAVRGLTKAYGPVLALAEADLDLARGEIRALMGENGAGKSTLIKCLTGAVPRDAGTILLGGEAISPRSPADAQRLGIATVYQEITLAPTLTVAESIVLGDESRRFGIIISWREMRRRAQAALGRLGLSLDVGSPIGSHPAAIRQLVAIARALDRRAQVLVLDEPTSSLDRDEVDRLFTLIRRLRSEGIAILFVTHFLDQVYALADSITVMRNGKVVGDWPVEDLGRKRLVEEMLGRSLGEIEARHRRGAPAGAPWLKAVGLGSRASMEPFDLELASGEVVALSGLLGSGRTETLELIFGAVAPDAGRLEIDGRERRLASPAESIRRGFAFTPEDRKEEGIFPGLSVADNLTIALQARRGWYRPMGTRKQSDLTRASIDRLGITVASPWQPIESLSGGNQQKVLLARWLALQPRLLLLDEPTRGIDIGAKFDFRGEIQRLADDGRTVLFSSAELEEIVHTADRVLVLRDRKVVGTLGGAGISEESIQRRIAGAAEP